MSFNTTVSNSPNRVSSRSLSPIASGKRLTTFRPRFRKAAGVKNHSLQIINKIQQGKLSNEDVKEIINLLKIMGKEDAKSFKDKMTKLVKPNSSDPVNGNVTSQEGATNDFRPSLSRSGSFDARENFEIVEQLCELSDEVEDISSKNKISTIGVITRSVGNTISNIGKGLYTALLMVGSHALGDGEYVKTEIENASKRSKLISKAITRKIDEKKETESPTGQRAFSPSISADLISTEPTEETKIDDMDITNLEKLLVESQNYEKFLVNFNAVDKIFGSVDSLCNSVARTFLTGDNTLNTGGSTDRESGIFDYDDIYPSDDSQTHEQSRSSDNPMANKNFSVSNKDLPGQVRGSISRDPPNTQENTPQLGNIKKNGLIGSVFVGVRTLTLASTLVAAGAVGGVLYVGSTTVCSMPRVVGNMVSDIKRSARSVGKTIGRLSASKATLEEYRKKVSNKDEMLKIEQEVCRDVLDQLEMKQVHDFSQLDPTKSEKCEEKIIEVINQGLEKLDSLQDNLQEKAPNLSKKILNQKENLRSLQAKLLREWKKGSGNRAVNYDVHFKNLLNPQNKDLGRKSLDKNEAKNNAQNPYKRGGKNRSGFNRVKRNVKAGLGFTTESNLIDTLTNKAVRIGSRRVRLDRNKRQLDSMIELTDKNTTNRIFCKAYESTAVITDGLSIVGDITAAAGRVMELDVVGMASLGRVVKYGGQSVKLISGMIEAGAITMHHNKEVADARDLLYQNLSKAFEEPINDNIEYNDIGSVKMDSDDENTYEKNDESMVKKLKEKYADGLKDFLADLEQSKESCEANILNAIVGVAFTAIGSAGGFSTDSSGANTSS